MCSTPRSRRYTFLSTPSARRATRTVCGEQGGIPFLSTPSARRATMYSARAPRTSRHFYPRPPRGGRPEYSESNAGAKEFLSTPSARRATGTFHGASRNTPYFYPRPPRGGRHIKPVRTEVLENGYFYPRPPRGGRLTLRWNKSEGGYFYPRPPRGGRPPRGQRQARCHAISIHALREEGDGAVGRLSRRVGEFLSTPSARRATTDTDEQAFGYQISIHALREEGDCLGC